MIEHLPWVGCEYQTGIGGKKIAIVGYSHHGGEDSEEYTKAVIRDVIDQSGKSGELVFFTRIAGYFPSDAPEVNFWNRVLFFNFVPDLIKGDRYGWADEEQVSRGRTRFASILDQYQPDKVLVFSKKAWYQLFLDPKKRLDTSSIQLQKDDRNPLKGYYSGRDGSHIRIYGLRHPQFANADRMTERVAEILPES